MIREVNTLGASPPRMVLHGGEKVGKSTFASQMQGVVFLPCEEGLKGLRANALVEQGKSRLETYSEFNNALAYLESNAHRFKGAVIDSGDWLEMLIHDHVAKSSNKKTITEAAGGYGKGYIEALNIWQNVLLRLDRLNKRGLWVIIIMHSKSVLFNDPMGEPYDIWTMKLHSPKGQNGSLELIKEWADIIGFACAERFVNETAASKANDKGDKSFRAVETGKRILHLQGTTGFLAGNRYGLERSCDLTWKAFMQLFMEAQQRQHNLR